MWVGYILKIPIMELSELTDKGLIPQIESIPGVEEAYVIREDKYDISIKLRESQLHKYDMQPNQVLKALRDREVDLSLGKFSDPSGKKNKCACTTSF